MSTTDFEKFHGRLGRVEFIALVAAMIAINAFAIDIMLPGLQDIGQSLGETDENRRQLVIPLYMLGFGILQLVFGPLADRFGRRTPLLAGMAVYVLAAGAAFFVTDMVGNQEEDELDWYDGSFVVDSTPPTVQWLSPANGASLETPLELLCEDSEVEPLKAALVEAARTGQAVAGWITVIDVISATPIH